MMLIQLLAQAAPPPPANTPWWQVLMDNALGLTILFIFLSAIIGAVIRMRRKDKCLKLLHDDHVSYIATTGKVMWGDMLVFSQGLEIQFDAPYHTPRGLVKNSILIFPDDLQQCLAVCRTASGLTEAEQQRRQQQIRRSFNPGPIRRAGRWIRNLFNTLRDAITKAFGAVVGQVAKSKPGSAIQSQQAGVQEIGQTLIGKANAYEPLLERHIGKPVILRLNAPAAENPSKIEIPGYLVDYTEHYVAVFNVEHTGIETLTLEVTESMEKPGISIVVDDAAVAITCTGEDMLVIQSLDAGAEHSNLDVVLTRGTTLKLSRRDNQPVKLTIDRTRQIDIVCPRSQADIRFGSMRESSATEDQRCKGVAPEAELSAELVDDECKAAATIN